MRSPLSAFIILCLLLTSCMSVAQKAVQALHNGDQATFCKLSAEHAERNDIDSINNVGVCYDNGYAGYSENDEIAIIWYTRAAKLGSDKAVANLKLHNVSAPHEYFVVKEQQRKKEQAIGAALGLAALAGVAAYAASKNNSAPTYNSYTSGQRSYTYVPNYTYGWCTRSLFKNYIGCCSYHQGIVENQFNQILCRSDGQVMCADQQPSPTCTVN